MVGVAVAGGAITVSPQDAAIAAAAPVADTGDPPARRPSALRPNARVSAAETGTPLPQDAEGEAPDAGLARDVHRVRFQTGGTIRPPGELLEGWEERLKVPPSSTAAFAEDELGRRVRACWPLARKWTTVCEESVAR
jgi:hypothetical protein